MAKSSPILVGLSLLAVTAAWASPTPPNIEKALAAQYQLVIERPQDSMVHNDLGNLLSLVERFGEAESAYMKAKELDPVDPSIRFNLGLLLQQTGRLNDAAEEYFALLELEPDHAWAYYQLGTVAFEQGKTKTARERYARSFAIDPTLSFSKHNPHVIDNPLATEALLMSSRMRTQSTNRVPRQYADAGRIADIMLDQPEKESVKVEARDEGESFEEMGGRDGSAPREMSSLGTPSSSDGLRRDEDGGSRVLTNEDLDAVERVGQAGSRGSRARSSRYSTSSRDSGSMGSAGTYEADRTQEPPSRYRPGDARRKDLENGNGGTQSYPGSVAIGQPVQRVQPAPGRPDIRSRPTPAPQPTEDDSVPSVQRRRYRPGSNSTAAVRLKMVGSGR